MELIDWVVLLGTLGGITAYGIWKARGSRDTRDYLLAKKMNWATVGLSVMATQASAITFLSTPGQAYSDGMRFVQFYFGLPLAMVVISATFVPIYQRLNVYTAYEFLEQRFDLKTRGLTAGLFLIQRGLAAGLTIFAPSLVLSAILGWEVSKTNLLLGGFVIARTIFGGSASVSFAQKQQMVVMLVGLGLAAYLLFDNLPANVSAGQAVAIAGQMGKTNALSFKFDLTDRYNLWSGLLGGFFLMLSYFGTDQSQVQRYLAGRSVAESRLGLLFNGFFKIPMQFGILFIGAILFVFYLFQPPPIFFNQVEVEKIKQSAQAPAFTELETTYAQAVAVRKQRAHDLATALEQANQAQVAQAGAALRQADTAATRVRERAVALIHQQNEADQRGKASDTNYIFLTFVINYLPHGLIGLLIAVICGASISASSSELNALAATTVIDVYKRTIRPQASEGHYLAASKWVTAGWGLYAILLAEFANSLSNNLIEAVNILGSLFYGTILGIFIVAFYVKSVKGNAVFAAALLAEAVVIAFWKYDVVSYLWLTLVGCASVVVFAGLFQLAFNRRPARV
jgi:solute:Na+ symporter, SSS family